MYKCTNCQTITKPKQKRLFVATYRDKGYTDSRGRAGGRGREIVEEKELCPDCYDKTSK